MLNIYKVDNKKSKYQITKNITELQNIKNVS